MTRQSRVKPVRRIVEDEDGREYVVELHATRVRIRPLGSRRGGPSDVSRGYGQIYLDAHGGDTLRAKGSRRRHAR